MINIDLRNAGQSKVSSSQSEVNAAVFGTIRRQNEVSVTIREKCRITGTDLGHVMLILVYIDAVCLYFH